MSDYLVLLLEQVTIFSSVTALILIAVKQIFKCRIPPRIGMALWIILLARLVCPVFPESRISVYNLIPAGKDVLYAIRSGDEGESPAGEADPLPEENPYVLTEVGAEPEEPLPVIPAPAPDYTIGGYLTDGSEAERNFINQIVIVIYLCGVVLSGGAALLMYEAAGRRALRGAIPVEDKKLLHLYGDTADHVAEMGSTPDRMASGLATHILRLADVYLVYAEAKIGASRGTTTDASAIDAFYQVRHRAVSTYNRPTSISWQDVWKERRLELALEGDRWYDFVRLAYYAPQEAVAEIKGQRRNSFNNVGTVYENYYNSGVWSGAENVTYDTTTPIPNVDENSFSLPFPQADVVFNKYLTDAPVEVDVRNVYAF